MLGTTLALSAARRSAGSAAAPPWWAAPDHLLDGAVPALAAE